MKRRLITLSALLLLTVCVSAYADVSLPLGNDLFATKDGVAAVNVAEDVLNDVKSGLFGANTSWIGGGSGIYDEQTLTFDPVMLQMIRDSGVTHIRLPGGIEGDYFHWHESVGPVSLRTAQINCFSRNWPTNAEKDGEKYIAYFGPDEWIELCKQTDTALTIQLNAGNGTPKEAVDFIQYCLDSGVEIESIAVGNEVNMAEERVEGIRVTKTPDEYIAFYTAVYERMSDAMKETLRVRGIPFGCIGLPAGHRLNVYKRWDAQVLSALGETTDFIDIHIGYTPYFTSGEDKETIVKCMLGSGKYVRDLINQEKRTISMNAPGTGIKISEYGPLGGNLSYGMPGAVFLSSFFRNVLEEPSVISADYLPLTNHYAANNLIGCFHIDDTKTVYWDNLVTFVYRMYAEQIGRSVLKTTVLGADTFRTNPVGLIPAVYDVSEIEAGVYYDAESGRGSILLNSLAYDTNTRVALNLPFDAVTLTGVTELSCENPYTRNYYTGKVYRVKPVEHETFAGLVCEGEISVEIKPISILKIDFIAK